MKKLLTLALVVSGITVSAQESAQEYKYAIKAYNLSSFEVLRGGSGLLRLNRIRRSNFVYVQPTIAFQRKTKKNNFHELELTRISSKGKYSNTNYYSMEGYENSGTRTLSELRIRYEYIFVLGKKKPRRLSPALGLAFSPFLIRSGYIPDQPSSFRASQSSVGSDFYFVPRLCYNLSPRLYFDLNTPVSLFHYQYNVSKSENPAIPKDLRRYVHDDLEWFRQFYSLRLGVGMRF